MSISCFRNIVEWPTNIPRCPQCSIKSIQSIGHLITKFIVWIFLSLKGYYLRSISIFTPKINNNSSKNQEDNDPTKSMPYIITSTSNSDIESDRSSNLPNNDSNELSNKGIAKDNFNTALITFYEEITNAAKQMFSGKEN